ncbi:lipoprotein N-acyltransferase Lnb domain-containing protein [Tellurirhabdus rosea]|uniref:lipoprotein N-acyltransferase Lnb domain-containing protein n=1 Tax=Tellurirhabdus rosea TaxID=2674997 RepID=UPI00225A31DE|nr:DUF4105 domain-containing protein [Tellurirhabdus rosea]
MRWLTALFILHSSFFILHSAKAQTLSPQTQVSLITVGPGDDDISSAFGHTEIRIFDPALGFDQNYSYGGFDYDADSFVLKFLRGTLPYTLSVHNLYQVTAYYQRVNRSMTEQVLNLSQSQKQQLFDALAKNYLPENRLYRYKFYHDNCSTRPRDMIVQAAGDSIRFDPTALDSTRSFRAWMNDYLGDWHWARFGMNMAVGRPADERNSAWVAMWLPQNVFIQFQKATILQPNGQRLPLVSENRPLVVAQPEQPGILSTILSPFIVFTAAFLLVVLLTRRQRRLGQRGTRFDRFFFGFLGFWGWFLFLLWVATDHGVTAWNPALLLMMPLHLPLIFWATRASAPERTRRYFAITSVLALLFYAYALLHGYSYESLPLVLIILTRTLFHFGRRENEVQPATRATA